MTKKIFAKSLRFGDETKFASKPGSEAQITVKVVKFLHLPNGKVEIRWADSTTDEDIFEGLYLNDEEVEILTKN